MAQVDDLDEILAQEFHKRDQTTKEFAPNDDQKFGSFTIVCLILNRTIGSGIFVTPLSIIQATDSPGTSLVLWAAMSIVAVCGLTLWLEFGLTVPRRIVMNGSDEKPVPRSGGEKNYLEYIMQRPKFLATSIYGIAFIVLGNLAGNSIAFATYVLRAAGYENAPRSWNIGVAIAALTGSCLVHVFSRRGGLTLSNVFAIFKVLVLVAIIVIGFATAGGAHLGPGVSYTSNLAPKEAFERPTSDVSSYVTSMFYILYTYSGFEQPFYVISEAKHPRKLYPKATYIAIAIAVVLFMLVNAAYLVATPLDRESLESAHDMASLFFISVFGPGIAARAMSAIIAVVIFGNLLVMTFTAARVKQEIAKEGILFFPPKFSIFISKAYATPDAWIRGKSRKNVSYGVPGESDADVPRDQSPMAALLLHWFMSVLLIAVTASMRADTAYFALVYLYSYVLLGMVGLCVSGGLLYLYCAPSANWPGRYGGQGFRPFGGPVWAFIYATTTLFLLAAAFVPPVADSPFGFARTHIQWYILPTIGLSSALWGVIWWCGLRLYGRFKGLELKVARVPYFERVDNGGGAIEDAEWVQRSEVIVHEWMSREYIRNLEMEEAKRQDSRSGGGSINSGSV